MNYTEEKRFYDVFHLTQSLSSFLKLSIDKFMQIRYYEEINIYTFIDNP